MLAVAAVLLASPSWAHKIKLFATGEGKAAEGYVYFPGGGRGSGLIVAAQAPDGTKIAEATTNANGEFRIELPFRCDYELVVATADGHRASFPIEAAELAADLPPYGGDAAPAAKPTTAASGEANPALPVALGLEERIAKVVRKEIRPLREQIEGYEERRRLHDILGGIGYIVGVAGIAFYFLGVSRRRARQTEKPSN